MLCPHCRQETGFTSTLPCVPLTTTLSWNPNIPGTATVPYPYWNTNNSTLTFTAPIGVPPYAPTLLSQDPQADAGAAQEVASADPFLCSPEEACQLILDRLADSSDGEEEDADECDRAIEEALASECILPEDESDGQDE